MSPASNFVDFVGLVTHELRSQLVSAARFLEIAKESRTRKEIERAELIIAEANRLLTNLYFLYAPDRERVYTQCQPITKNDLLDLLNRTQSRRRTSMKFIISSQVKLIAPRVLVDLAIQNLLAEAAMWAFPDSEIQFLATTTDTHAVFSVSYQGLEPAPGPVIGRDTAVLTYSKPRRRHDSGIPFAFTSVIAENLHGSFDVSSNGDNQELRLILPTRE